MTASKHQDLRLRSTAALHARFPQWLHTSGYTSTVEDNLIPGVCRSQFEKDLLQGAGQEMEVKFRALHSSSALAVNTFAPFKEDPAALTFLGLRGFTDLQFEKPVPTGLGGIAPHLDLWLQREGSVIAVESKFLEYLKPGRALYRKSYTRSALPQADAPWWQVLEDSRYASPQYLDVAQLVKHALGLLNYQRAHPTISITLVYLFWEPANAAAFSLCYHHRQQIDELARRVASSRLRFQALSYNELWAQWNSISSMERHLRHLRERYEFAV